MITVTIESAPISFAPASKTEEIVQNVRILLTTLQGTVPLNRSIGIDASFLDEPLPLAKVQLTSAIIEAVAFYEPRVSVERVEFQEDAVNGKLVPTVYLGEVD